ncbi:chemotaxis protein CheA [Sphingomonas sp.]|uniref:chemotaxis protein CheA n=1 Tax=Sphingomonas sp. TaxID=28214 RepID=UPI003AFFFC57
MDLDEIQQIFFQECDEGLATIEASFAEIRAGDTDPETINTVFRSVHSIKGGAGAFGHEALQAFTHCYETLLDLVRNGTLALDPALVGTIIAAFDMLADHVATARDGGEPPADAAMLARLAEAADVGGGQAAIELAGVAPATGTATSFEDGFDGLFDLIEGGGDAVAEDDVWTVEVRPEAGAFDNGAEPLLWLRELAALGGMVIEADTGSMPSLALLDPEQSYLRWTISVPGSVAEADIRSAFDFMSGGELVVKKECAQQVAPSDLFFDLEPVAPVPAEPAPMTAWQAPARTADTPAPAQTADTAAPPPRATAPAATQTIRVDLDKLDRLVNLVGELVITQSMLAQCLSQHGLTGVSELSDLDLLTRELQESTMAIRAQPMKTVFSRVPRIIRELESETGKRVRLEVEGEMTEVDKTVVERIGEPLTHLIRNAVDHGLEGPAERGEAGKPEEGVVRLSAAHQSGRIVITVADDGRGIDRGRVRAKAIERGIIPPDASLTDEETDNLIFAPGFSTAATITNVSGRGVGMDVVRKNVQALGGRIGIQSELGRGSSFSLSLPLTLAVLDGMIVTVGTQTFVIPLGHIVESLRPEKGQVRRLGAQSALFDVRGTYVPMHRVADQLGIADAAADPTQAVLIVVESDDGQAVLMVDTIQDQRQVVVKSLEANYQAIHGLAGATILGDGQVALILDIDALISRWRREQRCASPQERAA